MAPSIQRLAPEARQQALAEIKQFAKQWDVRDPHSLQAFAKDLQARFVGTGVGR